MTRIFLWMMIAVGLSVPAVQGQQPSRAQMNNDPFVRMVRHNDGSRTVTARSSHKDQQEITTYDAKGNLRLRRVYQLDRYGKPESFLIYSSAGTPILRGEFTYDVQDRMAEERLFELPSGEMVRRLIQGYDAAGRKLDSRQQNYKPLPSELLHWMNPDGSLPEVGGPVAGGGRGGGGRTGRGEEKKGLLKRVFRRNKK